MQFLKRPFRRPVKRVELKHGVLIRYSDGTILFDDDGKRHMPALFAIFRNGVIEADDALRRVKMP